MGHVPEEQQQQRTVIENNSLSEGKIHEFNGSVEHIQGIIFILIMPEMLILFSFSAHKSVCTRSFFIRLAVVACVRLWVAVF